MQPETNKTLVPQKLIVKIAPVNHINQMYPQMPKYAADPTQSKFIETYDHIMNRYQGHYGKQPEYFIRVPASATLFGGYYPYVSGDFTTGQNINRISVCSLQETVIAVGKNSANQIRINNYQKAIYGEMSLSTNQIQWKFSNKKKNKEDDTEQDRKEEFVNANDIQNPVVQEYQNIMIATLKASFGADRNSNQKVTGIDLLIYCNYLPQEHLEWRGSLIYGLHAAFQIVSKPKKPSRQPQDGNSISIDSFQKVLKRTQHLLSNWRIYNKTMLFGKYSEVLVQLSSQTLQSQSNQEKTEQSQQTFNLKFPENLTFVIANSMTPLPKKLVQGKRENLRHCQVLIAIQIIKAELGIVKSIKSIKQLQQNMTCSIEQLLQSIQQILPKQPQTHEQIEQLTEKTLIEILKQIPYANNVIDENVKFQPYKRITYFIKQQILIKSLVQKMKQMGGIQGKIDSPSDYADLFIKSLIQSTQNTQKYLNEPSQQIKSMNQKVQGLFKAYKILGNGWGGNVLYLCQKNNGTKIVQTLNKEFYLNQENRILLGDDLQMYTAVTDKPSNGLMILDPQSEIWY